MPHYTDHIARVSAVLQNTEPQARIAIYTPDVDIWKKQSRVFKPFPDKIAPWYIYELWNALHACGYNTNYVSDDVIEAAKMESGRLNYNQCAFDLLIMEDIRSIPLHTIKNLKNYVQAGGKLVFTGNLPNQAAGYSGAKQKGEEIRKIVAALQKNHPSNVFVFPAPGESSNLVAYAKEIMDKVQANPALDIQQPDEFVTQIHHKQNDNDLFFVINSHPGKDRKLSVKLPEPDGHVGLWDPQTGERYRVGVKDQRFNVVLPAGSSWFLVFGDALVETPLYQYATPEFKDTLEVKNWYIHCQPVVGESFSIDTNVLFDFSHAEDNRLKKFSGILTYTGSFEIDGEAFETLKIPVKSSVTELYINQEHVGINYFGNHHYVIKEFLKQGTNHIKIKVITTMGNYMKGRNTLAVNRWGAPQQKLQKAGILGPIMVEGCLRND
jgi:hypothetical protein